MRDYYQDGFDIGYGRGSSGNRDYPSTDGDDFSYRQGIEDGQRHRDIANDIDREYDGFD